MINKLHHGDALQILKTFPDESIDCCVTSPPYWNLRDYESDGQLGLEGTFTEYVNKLCDIFDEVKRVLKKTGTIWVNIGDTYYGSTKVKTDKSTAVDEKGNKLVLSKKSLCLVPDRFAIEMLNRGWILRNRIIWYKPAILPRALTDRFQIDFEDVFFFTKEDNYLFEQQYEKFLTYTVDPNATTDGTKYSEETITVSSKSMSKFAEKRANGEVEGRIKRCVWKINTSNSKSYHVAPYPEDLIIPMVKAGCPENGVVLDIFMGTGTTAVVALKQGKNFVGIDIDNRAISEAQKRIDAFLDQRTIFDLI